jgi:hypothetical protein
MIETLTGAKVSMEMIQMFVMYWENMLVWKEA